MEGLATDLEGQVAWALLFTQTFFQYLIFYTALAVSSATLGGLLTATGSPLVGSPLRHSY